VVKCGEFVGSEDVAPTSIGASVEERVGTAHEVRLEVCEFVGACWSHKRAFDALNDLLARMLFPDPSFRLEE
jgi:hypothetical protein